MTKHKNDTTPKEAPFMPGIYFEYYNQLLDSKIGKALKLRELSEKVVYHGAYNATKAGAVASRMFKGNGNKKAERLEPSKPSDYFDLSYNEDQQMIHETLQQFATKMRAAAEHVDEKMTIDQELWDEFNELNLTFIQVPEALGGMMKDKATVTQMIIAEDLAYGDLGQALAFSSHHSVLNAIIQWGTPEQQNDLVPGFLENNPTKATIALNEPQVLFSPFELSTKAVKNGENFTLNGTKNIVPMAAKSSFILVVADTVAHGPQVFIVDTKSAGLSITAERSMGLNAAELASLELKDVVVHESAVLGGQGGLNYTEFVNYCKLGWCAMAVGCCQAALDYLIPYTNDRYAFGEPISNRQAVAFMIADIKIELDSMRLLTQRAAAKAEQGLDFSREAYLAHVFCSDKSMQIGSNGVQLLGGHGYIRDFPVQRWYRDLRAVAISLNGVHL
jgi:alkylation response protein AidB-like acyl-CoA dehydrogenase